MAVHNMNSTAYTDTVTVGKRNNYMHHIPGTIHLCSRLYIQKILPNSADGMNLEYIQICDQVQHNTLQQRFIHGKSSSTIHLIMIDRYMINMQYMRANQETIGGDLISFYLFYFSVKPR
jgi:hypothetical protein